MAYTSDKSTSSATLYRDQDGPVLDTILVTGNPESIEEGALKLYFSNKKKCGGEGIFNIVVQQDKGFITFNDVQVAAKVAERKIHIILEREVTVELVASRKSVAGVKTNTLQNNILISNISESISDGILFLYIDNLAELNGEGGDYTIKRNGSSQVVVSFDTSALPSGGINSVISKINSKPLKGTTLIATECMVKTTDSVASNSAVLTNDILIDNLPDEKCSTSKLSKHFCSKKKSGISFCKGIKIVKRNMAVIQLEDENAVEIVLSHKHDKLSKTVILARCVDLTLCKEPSYSIVPLVDNSTVPSLDNSKEVVSNQPFSIKVAQDYMACLKLYHQNIDDQLKTFHASMHLDEGQCALQIVPCQGNESIEDWQSHCKSAVDTFVGSLTVETLSISVDKKDIMHPVIDMMIQQEKALHIEYAQGSISIAGEQSDVNRMKKKLEESYQAIVSETIPIKDEKFFLLLTAKLKYRIPDDPLEIQASTNPDDHSVTITGFEEKCEAFKSDLQNQMNHMQCVPVLLNDLFIEFLCTESGKILLKYYAQSFRSEVVTYFDSTGKLFILGTAESQVAINKLIQIIQSGLYCFHIACPPSAEKFRQGKEWLDFCTKLALKQYVQIKSAMHRIIVIGDIRLSDPVKKQIVKFIDSECQPMKQFELCNAQWRVIQSYMTKKWQRLEKELRREKQIQLVVPDVHDEDPVIIVEGEMSKVELARKKIERFLSLIVSSTPNKQIRCDVVKYFLNKKGKTAVGQIEQKEHSCVQISIENDSADQLSLTDTLTRFNETSLGSPYIVKQRVLLLQVFAIDGEVVRKTDTCLQELIKSRLFMDKIDDRIVSQITPKQRSTIEQKAKAKNVDIIIEASRMKHYIQMEGDLSSIITLKQEIHSILHESHVTETMKRDIKGTQAKVKWQWQNKSGAYEDYDILANYDIEQAYQSDQSALFDTQDSAEQFNFQQMETRNKNDQSVYKIKRSEVKFADLPREWSPMPEDTICHKVTLDASSNEYSQVKKLFTATMPVPQQQFTLCDFHWNHIVKIERIQSPVLYTQYVNRKKGVVECNSSGLKNEMKLFYGCRQDAVDKISHWGFDITFAGNNAINTAAYGRGILFARHANHPASDKYSPCDSSSHKYIFVAKVLTGELARYDSRLSGSMTKTCCRCGVDDVSNPTIFVVYDDSQAYPEYLITFI